MLVDLHWLLLDSLQGGYVEMRDADVKNTLRQPENRNFMAMKVYVPNPVHIIRR